MQRPTINNLRIRTTSDADTIFHAVRHGMLPMVRRRLDSEERRNITSGDVFVWEERITGEASGLGIERWTDSIHWGPSRTRDDFLFYHEKPSHDGDAIRDSFDMPYRRPLVKQTYSVYTERTGRRKWHLIAYFTQDTLDQLRKVGDVPGIAGIFVPSGAYKAARNPKRTAREMSSSASLPVGRSFHRPYQYQPRDTTSDGDAGDHARLAPLQYLQSIPPQRRHVVDEMALIRLPMTINAGTFSSSHVSHALHRHLPPPSLIYSS